MIEITLANHTIKTYSLQGKIIDNFCIRNVEEMTYKTAELNIPSQTMMRVNSITVVKHITYRLRPNVRSMKQNGVGMA